MVRLSIIVEGEAPGGNADAVTAANAESLREALHSFFSRLLGEDALEIAVYMGRGYRAAARRFLSGPEDACLYVDSDHPYGDREKWHDMLLNPGNPEKDIVIPGRLRPSVFFMVQEMEAWFLKQPECLDRWAEGNGYTRRRRHADDAISDHSVIKGKDVESIVKPSEKTALIVKTFFEDEKGKSVRYGKLRSAPGILDELDADALKEADRELARFTAAFTPHVNTDTDDGNQE